MSVALNMGLPASTPPCPQLIPGRRHASTQRPVRAEVAFPDVAIIENPHRLVSGHASAPDAGLTRSAASVSPMQLPTSTRPGATAQGRCPCRRGPSRRTSRPALWTPRAPAKWCCSFSSASFISRVRDLYDHLRDLYNASPPACLPSGIFRCHAWWMLRLLRTAAHSRT